MAQTLLYRGQRITLEEALEKETNVLEELSHNEKRNKFGYSLFCRGRELEKLVALHLGIPTNRCTLGKPNVWINGSFNWCVPFDITDVNGNHEKRVLMRFPLPYKLGESFCPGNLGEKLRCEAATYLWLQEHCPDVPIATLRGFGFPNGQSFSRPADCSLLQRIYWSCRRTFTWLLGQPVPCRYVPRQLPQLTHAPYLLLDFVKEGQMLSKTWDELRHDRTRRANIYADISRVMLSISTQTFPRIGSLTIDQRGVIKLANRPLTWLIHELENDQVPADMPRDRTYAETDSYYSDLLNTHSNRIRDVANSINNVDDGELQLSVLTMMRALSRHYADPELRSGPFVLMLTDLHQSNVFVDENWHITALIDLEWACVRPLEMLQPPYWLTSKSVDNLKGENLKEYDEQRLEFMAAFEKEETKSHSTLDISRSQTMEKCWKIGNFWYFIAMDTFVGMCNIYKHHIGPKFLVLPRISAGFERDTSLYWTPHANTFITAKLEERKKYQDRIRETFAQVAREQAEKDGAQKEQ
ncbi:hypothetical protein MBLNU457_6931t1 [Dothideomycetes sp. NU457]